VKLFGFEIEHGDFQPFRADVNFHALRSAAHRVALVLSRFLTRVARVPNRDVRVRV
jgi:hypothetical protein